MAGFDGISSAEVGLLAATPGPGVRRDSDDYVDGDASTFGAPNRWDDRTQDLDALRDRGAPPLGIDTGAPATPPATAPAACGCAATPRALTGAWLGLLVLAWRRRALGLAALVGCADPAPEPVEATTSCFADADADGFGAAGSDPIPCDAETARGDADCDDGDPWVNPAGTEICGGGDEDCDGLVDDDDPDVADPLAFYADEDRDGWGGAPTTACVLGPEDALQGGDCDDGDPDIHPGAEEQCDEVDRDCDGIAGTDAGASAACALDSCAEALDLFGPGVDGAYWIRVSSGDAALLWCDLSTDGGGWTLGFLRSSSGSGDQGDFGAGEVDLEALSVSPAMASDDPTPRRGWLDLNATAYAELRLTAALYGVETYRSEVIPRAHLRLAFGEPGYLLYGGESPYLWCGGPASYTDAGIGQVDRPPGAPADCKGHGSVGSGWDFSTSTWVNQGLTLCGSDASNWIHGSWGGTYIAYGTPGAAQAIWVR